MFKNTKKIIELEMRIHELEKIVNGHKRESRFGYCPTHIVGIRTLVSLLMEYHKFTTNYIELNTGEFKLHRMK